MILSDMYSNSYLSQKVESIAERNYVTLSEDTLVGTAAKVMKDKDVLSVLVTSKDSNERIGILTERDLLYRVLADNKGPFKVTLKKIMSYPLITIAEEESVKNAVLLMRGKHIRRLAVKSARGNITGLITLKSIVGNIPSDKVELAEVELPSNTIERATTKIICPYCQSQFKDKAEVSKHIDRIHIGGDPLEGDMRQL
jgi:signal-transduction protein with cAMP-binding, CBS, and nucleotidyltransferase domain